MAADSEKKAPREYVVSEFVQPVVRNNLMIKAEQTDKILAAFEDNKDIGEEYKADFAGMQAVMEALKGDKAAQREALEAM